MRNKQRLSAFKKWYEALSPKKQKELKDYTMEISGIKSEKTFYNYLNGETAVSKLLATAIARKAKVDVKKLFPKIST